MRKGNATAKCLAMGLIVCMQCLYVPALAGSSVAGLSGSILTSGSGSPLADARVHVASPDSGEVFSSEPTGADGVFNLAGLPAGDYELAIEAGGGMYVVRTPLPLAPGQTQNLKLAVSPKKKKSGLKSGATKASIWNNPFTAALIVVGSAAVVGIVVDSGDQTDAPVSPSS